ncbi:MAG TPA: thioesterase domain-containing protein, partial [bacterium]|nr:thioesterase domain-containing protein [bacterium]
AMFSSRFRGERPVYGLRGIGLRPEGNRGRYRRMTDLAEDLVDEILHRFPDQGEGKGYVLAGYSFGASMAMAAARILDSGWTGRHVPELRGPEDLTFDEVAATIGDALGRKVAHVRVTADQMREALAGMGASPNAADTMVELYEGITAGRLDHTLPGTPETTGPTTVAEFARTVMAPAAQAAGAG